MKKNIMTIVALSVLFTPLAFAKDNKEMSKGGFQNQNNNQYLNQDKNQYMNQYQYQNQGQSQKNTYQQKNKNGFNYSIQTKQGSNY